MSDLRWLNSKVKLKTRLRQVTIKIFWKSQNLSMWFFVLPGTENEGNFRPRLNGSGQIFERTKTCTDPPFVNGTRGTVEIFERRTVQQSVTELAPIRVNGLHRSKIRPSTCKRGRRERSVTWSIQQRMAGGPISRDRNPPLMCEKSY